MDTIHLTITSEENVKSTFTNADSEQATATTTRVSAALPQVEHVHSIEPTTLLWLLLVYFVVRMAQPFIAHRRRMVNGEGDSQADSARPIKKAPVKRTPRK